MEKTKIIKIIVAVVIAIFAMIYYLNTNTENYEDIEINNVVVENNTNKENEENIKEEEKIKIKVYVTGEVNKPGVIELEEGARIEDAISGCGGITSQANLKNINLAYEVSDGEKIYIPNLSENETEEDTNENINQEESSSNSNKKININKATESEMTSVPGIGKSTAEKIIAYRDENGKFKSVEDIKNVSGIGDSKYEKMKDYISVK